MSVLHTVLRLARSATVGCCLLAPIVNPAAATDATPAALPISETIRSVAAAPLPKPAPEIRLAARAPAVALSTRIGAPRLDTPLARRWALARHRIAAETAWLASCGRGACRDPRAERWQRMVAYLAEVPVAARAARVHRLIDRRIRYVADRGADDLWSTPLATLLRGAGDCEDHALLKRALLLATGTPDDDMRLLILRTRKGLGHMALEVAGPGEDDGRGELVLDNRFRRPMRIAALADDRIAAIATGQGYFTVGR